MTYRPEPLDTDAVELPTELRPLTERLAEHIHDLWAAGRIAEGWSYGPERSDSEKTHPGLVPYDQLSDSEKEYDRRTAIGALKAISMLGFEIRRRE